jgi:anti-anti-sigma factor
MEFDAVRVFSGVDDLAATVVELHGDIDRHVADPLWDCVVSGMERGADVLVDLADVTLIDCASLSTLVEARHLADRRGGTVCLVAPAAAVRRTLAATGLDTVFLTFHDRDQAVRQLSAAA